MLKQFDVQNFRGFKSRLSFDLSAGDYQFNSSVIKNGIIKNALVYGMNGSGKSSLGLALFDIIAHLTDKAQFQPAVLEPYRNLDMPDNQPAVFRYVISLDCGEVVYSYEKVASQVLISELLTLDGRKIVDWNYFDAQRQFVDPEMTNGLTVELHDNHLSVIKYLYRNMPTNGIPAITQLVKFVEGMLWYRSLSDGNAFAGFQNGARLLTDIIAEAGALDDFRRFLAENNLHYNLEFRPVNGQQVLCALFDGGKKVVPFSMISSTGTQTLLLFFSWRIAAFDKLTFLFVDEFDAFFHFEAAQSILRKINEGSFQSVLTSHNTFLMNNELSRPDACFVIADGEIKNLQRRTNKAIREGHNLEKMYVNGAFA